MTRIIYHCRSYAEYLRDEYGPEKAERILTRPDINYAEVQKLRRVMAKENEDSVQMKKHF